MASAETIARTVDEAGTRSEREEPKDPRELPYYCSWYRSIFTRTAAGAGNRDVKAAGTA